MSRSSAQKAGWGVSVHVEAVLVLTSMSGAAGKVVLRQGDHPVDSTADVRAGRDHLAWHFPRYSTAIFSCYFA